MRCELTGRRLTKPHDGWDIQNADADEDDDSCAGEEESRAMERLTDVQDERSDAMD